MFPAAAHLTTILVKWSATQFHVLPIIPQTDREEQISQIRFPA